jgi:hypothetical protein
MKSFLLATFASTDGYSHYIAAFPAFHFPAILALIALPDENVLEFFAQGAVRHFQRPDIVEQFAHCVLRHRDELGVFGGDDLHRTLVEKFPVFAPSPVVTAKKYFTAAIALCGSPFAISCGLKEVSELGEFPVNHLSLYLSHCVLLR